MKIKTLLIFMLSLLALACSNPGRGVAPENPDQKIKDQNLQGLINAENFNAIQARAVQDPFNPDLVLITVWPEAFQDPCDPQNTSDYSLVIRLPLKTGKNEFGIEHYATFNYPVNKAIVGDIGVFQIEELLQDQITVSAHIRTLDPDLFEVDGFFTAQFCNE